MGQDKAGVLITGEPLWQRQLATLRACRAREVFISGKADGPYALADVEILIDAVPGLGPLGGLAASLRRASCPLVLVLAIDLPAMTAAFLSSLVNETAAGVQGCVPRDGAWFQPLAAVYPRACLPLVGACLRDEDRSMQRFVRLAAAQGWVKIRELTPDERPLFRNVNQPGDLEETT